MRTNFKTLVVYKQEFPLLRFFFNIFDKKNGKMIWCQ